MFTVQYINSAADVKEIEKTTLNLLHGENTDIRQKRDPARSLFNFPSVT